MIKRCSIGCVDDSVVRSARILPNRVVAQFKPQHSQQGVILIVALIVLVALTLASVGLLRSVDTASTISSNLGIKKDLYRAAGIGMQVAAQRLTVIRGGSPSLAGGAVPGADMPSSGFYSTASLPVDRRGIPQILVNAPIPRGPGIATNYGGVGESVVPIQEDNGSGVTAVGGYVFRWVFERSCPNVGVTDDPAAPNPCRTAAGTLEATSHGKERKLPPEQTPYVRITMRVDGPKNSTSYFQSMLL